nr:putative toxin-antitoxin system toxin component, PIN family [Caenimonas aquaedulcis]
MRVVFDTSSIVGAVLLARSIPNQAYRRALSLARLCASAETLDELQDVLRRPKFDRYLPIASRREFFDSLVRVVEIHDVPQAVTRALRPRSRDPADDKFLALAVSCDADIIVSSDEDLLCLDPWHRVRIMTPAGFIGSSASVFT